MTKEERRIKSRESNAKELPPHYQQFLLKAINSKKIRIANVETSKSNY